MDEDTRDEWCMNGHSDFCEAVESRIRELMNDHEQHENDHSGENGEHGSHYDHGEHNEADKILFE